MNLIKGADIKKAAVPGGRWTLAREADTSIHIGLSSRSKQHQKHLYDSASGQNKTKIHDYLRWWR